MHTGSGRRASSGARHRVVARPPNLTVREISFDSQMDIWYARIPDRRVTYVVAPSGTVHNHLSPPEVRPATGDPHWRKSGSSNAPEFSWPAVYLRDGAPNANREVHVSFETSSSFNGTLYIGATSPSGVELGEEPVSFTAGTANNVRFMLQNLPGTVRWLSGIVLNWQYRLNLSSSFSRANDTQHTLFITDGSPSSANLRHQDRFLFEIVDWACRWVHGYTGHQAVLGAIWRKFDPVRAVHDTGLVYWRNWNRGIQPAQDIASAVQSQDHSNAQQRNAASCIVFDRILINCLAVHGIESAEIMVERPTASFSRGGRNYVCTRWVATTRTGQGNTAAPPRWRNHWIATVATQASQWRFYDGSYGAGPANCPQAPQLNNAIDIAAYEPLTARAFECRDLASGSTVDLPRDADPAVSPHLRGEVLWVP